MIKDVMMHSEVKAYIQEKLKALQEDHQVRILLASESGSRAWGFPSKDSDYDVRFIYVRSQEDYLSITPPRDVLETPLNHDAFLGVPFDLNGWDIRKAIHLATKSNPVLIEWLSSPIYYQIDQEAVNGLLCFAKSVANLNIFAYHYDRLAQNAWTQIESSMDQLRLKLYCYALRPALALAWIRHFGEFPPMDVPNLCKRLPLSTEFIGEIEKLIEAKEGARESDLVSRNPILDSYIHSVLNEKAERQEVQEPDKIVVEKANHLFRKFLSL